MGIVGTHISNLRFAQPILSHFQRLRFSGHLSNRVVFFGVLSCLMIADGPFSTAFLFSGLYLYVSAWDRFKHITTTLKLSAICQIGSIGRSLDLYPGAGSSILLF